MRAFDLKQILSADRHGTSGERRRREARDQRQIERIAGEAAPPRDDPLVERQAQRPAVDLDPQQVDRVRVEDEVLAGRPQFGSSSLSSILTR